MAPPRVMSDTNEPDETPGDRLFEIRLACGGGRRKAEPMTAFVERVKEATGAVYDPSTISLLERMIQGWTLDDVTTFAAVDPKGRGKVWLAFGKEGEDEARGSADAPPDRTRPVPEPKPAEPLPGYIPATGRSADKRRKEA